MVVTFRTHPFDPPSPQNPAPLPRCNHLIAQNVTNVPPLYSFPVRSFVVRPISPPKLLSRRPFCFRLSFSPPSASRHLLYRSSFPPFLNGLSSPSFGFQPTVRVPTFHSRFLLCPTSTVPLTPSGLSSTLSLRAMPGEFNFLIFRFLGAPDSFFLLRQVYLRFCLFRLNRHPLCPSRKRNTFL